MRRILFYLYLLALVAATFMQAQRWSQERSNRTVEPVLDFAAVDDYAHAKGQPTEEVLKEFCNALSTGAYRARSLAFAEQKLDDLEARGVCATFDGTQLIVAMGWLDAPEGSPRPDPSKTYIVVLKDGQAEFIRSAIALGLGEKVVRLWPAPGSPTPPSWKQPKHQILEVDRSEHALALVGLGFSEEVNDWSRKGYNVWLRPENMPLTDALTCTKILNGCAQFKPQGLIFGGTANEALGYPDPNVLGNITAEYIRNKQWKVGFIELDKKVQQKGMETIVRAIPQWVVRVFAMAPAHMNPLKPERVGQMYSLGARERNIRLLYLRPYPYTASPEEGFVNATTSMLTIIKEDVGGRFGSASLFRDPVRIHPLVGALMALGSGAIAWILWAEYAAIPALLCAISLLGFAAVGAAGSVLVGKGLLLRSLLALFTAACAGLYANVHFFPNLEQAARKTTPGSVMLASIGVWLRMLAVALSGAWLASAFLQDTTYKLGLDTFRGVKLLTVGIPLLVVLAWFARDPQGTGSPLERLVQTFSLRIRLYHLIGLGLLLLVAVFYTLRTGNVGGEVSGEAMDYERLLRMFLDKYLGVRPRFKEFLIAHPAMILTPLVIWLRGRNLAWVLILAGSTGVVGLCDTFAHIHTPLQISLVRCVLGALVGAVLALIFGTVLSQLVLRFRGQRPARIVGPAPTLAAAPPAGLPAPPDPECSLPLL